ncbi:MAG TPA: hypothetical protein VH595_07340 [Verrucomicrobiae bacterium]|nr:hypothetical protein [Verrucomicrobiae bacterium]
MELLTHLGFETGFTTKEIASQKFKEARAGLEFDIRHPTCPFILKWPNFCDYADEVLQREDIVIEHIFIPVRDLKAAAESRRFVHRSSFEKLSLLDKLKYRIKPWVFPGGLWRTTSDDPGRQEAVLLNQVYKLMLAVSNASIPLTFLHYPRITRDAQYLFGKLQPIMNGAKFESFNTAFAQTVRPELVHSFTDADR